MDDMTADDYEEYFLLMTSDLDTSYFERSFTHADVEMNPPPSPTPTDIDPDTEQFASQGSMQLQAERSIHFYDPTEYMGEYEHILHSYPHRPMPGHILRALLDIGWLKTEEVQRRCTIADLEQLFTYDDDCLFDTPLPVERPSDAWTHVMLLDAPPESGEARYKMTASVKIMCMEKDEEYWDAVDWEEREKEERVEESELTVSLAAGFIPPPPLSQITQRGWQLDDFEPPAPAKKSKLERCSTMERLYWEPVWAAEEEEANRAEALETVKGFAIGLPVLRSPPDDGSPPLSQLTRKGWHFEDFA